jgi:hypothetical protein
MPKRSILSAFHGPVLPWPTHSIQIDFTRFYGPTCLIWKRGKLPSNGMAHPLLTAVLSGRLRSGHRRRRRRLMTTTGPQAACPGDCSRCAVGDATEFSTGETAGPRPAPRLMGGAAAIFVAPLAAAVLGGALCRPLPALQAPGSVLAMVITIVAVRQFIGRQIPVPPEGTDR